MKTLQDGAKRGRARCDPEERNVEGSNVEENNVDRSEAEGSDFVAVIHVEEDPEESGRCPGCTELHLLGTLPIFAAM